MKVRGLGVGGPVWSVRGDVTPQEGLQLGEGDVVGPLGEPGVDPAACGKRKGLTEGEPVDGIGRLGVGTRGGRLSTWQGARRPRRVEWN